ncbi:uncharacterized protein AMSG_06950 [Thecamonas trahens ATCC 50062]|uniref:Uncharacterized protein n=1 Tax=Thecamonas trahens ATCC 50062 TaxID=461836 RepID=A0A0L0DF60_THETB|nr:hypothetical protein AMSG_06950 [Thecamonas trahens ATCC 50062]KNC50982.1 hypothetical protein AMSG_06950 [Thecamonas trahens ATCC 50062]|eukprot:XP_013756453.1 hypothetical protein AMSG_06950 [Thecamonas trahens ATCC 50062]
MFSPRDAAGNAVECTGSEAWAGDYLYPNEWSLTCHKKVAILDKDPSWAMHRTDDAKAMLWLLLALVVYLGFNMVGFWEHHFE